MPRSSGRKTDDNPKTERVGHGFGPFCFPDSKVLILGSFPSVKSREEGFYYMHPRNRFYAVLGLIFNEEVPLDVEGRRDFLRRHRIALYDVVSSCVISGSLDSAIRDPMPADLEALRREAPGIVAIFVLGRKAQNLFRRFFGDGFIPLPSTSPANAAVSLEDLAASFDSIRKALDS